MRREGRHSGRGPAFTISGANAGERRIRGDHRLHEQVDVAAGSAYVEAAEELVVEGFFFFASAPTGPARPMNGGARSAVEGRLRSRSSVCFLGTRAGCPHPEDDVELASEGRTCAEIKSHFRRRIHR